MSSIIMSVFLLFASVTATNALVADSTIYFSQDDCSNVYFLPLDDSPTIVKVKTPTSVGVIGDHCNVTFRTEDASGYISLRFGDDDGDVCSISDSRVSISLYSNEGLNVSKLIRTYTEVNSSKLVGQPDEIFTTNSLSVMINGHNSTYWDFAFQIHAADGPISGYPFSIAGGVIAVSVTGVVVLALIIVGCYCCCCLTTDRQRVSVPRRARIIDQLRKEGYSVTRDYGAITDRTAILRNHASNSAVAPPRSQGESPRYPPRGASNYDPPPSYDVVGGMRAPQQQQHSAPQITVLQTNYPTSFMGPQRIEHNQPGYSANFYPVAPIPNAEPTAPKPPSPPPDVNLIDLETDLSEVQQLTHHRATEILLHFETPPERAPVNVDLL